MIKKAEGMFQVSFSYSRFVLVLGSLLLSGCLVIPTTVTTPLPHGEIDSIQIHKSDKSSVSRLFGEPDVKRDAGNIWIYSGGQKSAVFVMLIDNFPSDNLYNYEWLFLRFDKQGRVAEKELVEEKEGCTKSGYCLSGYWREKNGKYHLVDKSTLLYQETVNQDVPAVAPGYCRLYLYYVPGENDSFLSRHMIAVKINDSQPVILDANTYARLDITAGQFSVSLPGHGEIDWSYALKDLHRRREIRNNRAFTCPDRQSRYYGLSLTIDEQLPNKKLEPDIIDISEVDKVKAKTSIQERESIENP